MIRVVCPYEPPHYHEYPDDWVFGGADGTHPGADPRWEATRYYYYDGKFDLIEVTTMPICDDEAIDGFTRVAKFGPSYNPVYIGKRAPGESVPDMMPWTYNKETDEVEAIVRA